MGGGGFRPTRPCPWTRRPALMRPLVRRLDRLLPLLWRLPHMLPFTAVCQSSSVTLLTLPPLRLERLLLLLRRRLQEPQVPGAAGAEERARVRWVDPQGGDAGGVRPPNAALPPPPRPAPRSPRPASACMLALTDRHTRTLAGFDVETDPRAPTLGKIVEPAEIQARPCCVTGQRGGRDAGTQGWQRLHACVWEGGGEGGGEGEQMEPGCHSPPPPPRRRRRGWPICTPPTAWAAGRS